MQIHAPSNSPSSPSKADEAHPGELCEPWVEHDATTRLSSSSSFSATQRAPSSKRKFAASDAHTQKRQLLLAAGAVGAERAPAEGQDWRELFLSADKDAASTASVAEAVVLGHSLLLLDGLASAHECSALLSEAVAVAARVRRENFGQREEAGEGHFSGSEETQSEEEERADTGSEAAGHEAAGEEAGRIAVDLPPADCLMLSNHSRIRLPVARMLSTQAQHTCDALLIRSLRRLREVPALAALLFGDALHAMEEGDSWCRLEFAAGEPAVNVYTAGGSFTPHQDGQCLSVLVNLSDPSSFQGGGTAFWSLADNGRDEGGRVCLPHTLVLTLPAGAALLFVGSVTHAGRQVSSGERVVFVASFSPRASQ